MSELNGQEKISRVFITVSSWECVCVSSPLFAFFYGTRHVDWMSMTKSFGDSDDSRFRWYQSNSPDKNKIYRLDDSRSI